MNFSNELIEKAKTASSVEELLEMAKAEGIVLSAADAETYFSFLKNNGPLSDEELEQVAGGKGKKETDPKYKVGQAVEKTWDLTPMTAKGTIIGLGWYNDQDGWTYNVHYYQEIHPPVSKKDPPIIVEISRDCYEYLETNKACKVY